MLEFKNGIIYSNSRAVGNIKDGIIRQGMAVHLAVRNGEDAFGFDTFVSGAVHHRLTAFEKQVSIELQAFGRDTVGTIAAATRKASPTAA